MKKNKIKKLKEILYSIKPEKRNELTDKTLDKLSDRYNYIVKNIKNQGKFDEAISILEKKIEEFYKQLGQKANEVSMSEKAQILEKSINEIKINISGNKVGVENNINLINKKIDNLISETKNFVEKDENKDNDLSKKIEFLSDEIKRLWLEIKIWAEKLENKDSGYVVQGTTRLKLFLNNASLNDTFNELNFIAGTGISLTSAVNTTTRKTDLTISAPGSTTDEKVKLNASDPVAGYLDAKLVESGKVILTDQTSPQTMTGGAFSGSGLFKLTNGLLGVDTNSYALASALAGYVPYTGAYKTVDVNTQTIISGENIVQDPVGINYDGSNRASVITHTNGSVETLTYNLDNTLNTITIVLGAKTIIKTCNYINGVFQNTTIS